MSLSNLVREQLKSRAIRVTATNNENGLRKIEKGQKEGLLQSLIKLTGGLFGSLLNLGSWLLGGVIGAVGFSFTALWGLLVSTTTFIWNFNWNASDQQLDALLNNWKAQIAGQVGELLGNSLGFLICGGIPGIVAFKFNQSLGLYILQEVGEEAFDEFEGNLRALVNSLATAAVQAFLINAYKSTRRFIKDYFKNPNSVQSQIAQRIFGSKFNDAVKGWGAENSKPWSFAIAQQEWIESFEDPVIENFLEEFFDGLAEGCVEAGYVVAGSLDAWVTEKRLEKNILLGSETVLEVQPNREVEEERLILAGRQELVKAQVTQALGVTYPIMDNRDVGQWVGEPIRVGIRKAAPISIQMRIVLNEKEQSPFIKRVRIDGKDVIRPSKRVQITIPSVKREKIDWEKIKLAVGGKNGYMWGRFAGKARLSDGSNISLSAATSEEVKDRIEALLEFTNADLLGITINEVTKEGKRKIHESLYPEPTRIYPIAFTIINQQKILNEESGITQLSGTYKRKKDLIPLNVDEKPDDFETTIQELFRIPGTNSTP